MSDFKTVGCRYYPPTREVEGKGGQPQGDRVEIYIYARLSITSIILCLISIGVVTVLTLLAIRCIELYLSG